MRNTAQAVKRLKREPQNNSTDAHWSAGGELREKKENKKRKI